MPEQVVAVVADPLHFTAGFSSSNITISAAGEREEIIPEHLVKVAEAEED